MKGEKKLSKAYQAYLDDVEEALLLLARLKQRADYRTYFEENWEKVEAAHSRRDADAKETISRFHEDMRLRFGIPPASYAGRSIEDWRWLFNPLTDPREASEAIRRELLPWLFFRHGIREVVTPPPGRPAVWHLSGRGETPRLTIDAECAPYERLLKIDLRRNPSVLKKQFEAFLDAVDARREMDPAAYKEWKQDRSRKREEAWQHLTVWRMRRQVPKPSFPEIARELRITPAAAKKSFYRAYELIYGTPFDRKAWEKERAENRSKTCANCPQREGCTEPCPEIFDEKMSNPDYIPGDADVNETLEGRTGSRADAYSYQEWLTREEENE